MGTQPPAIHDDFERDDQAPLPLGEFLLRLAKQAIVVGVVLSIVIHLGGVVASSFVRVGGGIIGSKLAGNGEVEVATVTEGELDQIAGEAGGLDAPGVPEAMSSVSVPSPAIEGGMAGGDAEAPGLGASGDVGVLGGGGDLGGVGSGLGGAGGGGGASFFGVEASGNRFVFIVDVSGSMGYGGKLEELKRQLAISVGALAEASQFVVLPFSDTVRPLGGKSEWTEASTGGKRWALQQIELLNSNGGTEPREAFRMSFALRPRPDAIYFMTDGEFDPSVADEVAVSNAKLRIPVHCICFTTEGSEELMKKIARESRGTYRFVPGPK